MYKCTVIKILCAFSEHLLSYIPVFFFISLFISAQVYQFSQMIYIEVGHPSMKCLLILHIIRFCSQEGKYRFQRWVCRIGSDRRAIQISEDRSVEKGPTEGQQLGLQKGSNRRALQVCRKGSDRRAIQILEMESIE